MFEFLLLNYMLCVAKLICPFVYLSNEKQISFRIPSALIYFCLYFSMQILLLTYWISMAPLFVDYLEIHVCFTEEIMWRLVS